MAELNEKIKRVFADLRIRCAYNMPIFWANSGKDYKVIPTKYAKGYQKALEDAEREITEVLSEQPEIIHCRDCKHWTNNVNDSELRDNYCDEEAHGFYYQCSGDDYCSFAERKEDASSR